MSQSPSPFRALAANVATLLLSCTFIAQPQAIHAETSERLASTSSSTNVRTTKSFNQRTDATELDAIAEASGKGDSTGKLWTVLVGVNDYSMSRLGDNAIEFDDLNCPVADIEGIEHTLLRMNIPSAQIFALHDQQTADKQPTREQLVSTLETLANHPDLGPNDTLMFVFSGHGINIGDDSYICLADTEIRTTTNLEITRPGLLAIRDLLAFTEQIDVGAKVILTDACREAISDHEAGVNAYDLSQHVRRMSASEQPARNQVMIVSSCLPGQVSVELPLAHEDRQLKRTNERPQGELQDEATASEQHSLFLGHFIKGLQGAAGFQLEGNHDSVMTMYEAFQYASWNTIKDAREGNFRQDPFAESASSSIVRLFEIPAEVQAEFREALPQPRDALTLDQKTARLELYPSALDELPFSSQATIATINKAITLDPDYLGHIRLRRTAYLLQADYVNAVADSQSLHEQLKVRVHLPSDATLKIKTFGEGTDWSAKDGSTLYINSLSQARTTSRGVEPKGHWLHVARCQLNKDAEPLTVNAWVLASELRVDRVDAAQRLYRENHTPQPANIQRRYSYQPTAGGNAAARLQRAGTAIRQVDEAIGNINQGLNQVGRIPYAGQYVPRIPTLRSYLPF